MSTNRELFYNLQAQTTAHPMDLEIVRAEGLWITDAAGNEYMDLVSGLAVTNLGHRHPKVVAAIKEQCDQYLHAMPYGEFVQAPQTKLARALVARTPENLNNVYFVNSGAEAVEGALKLAKRYTGRPELLAFVGAYHGSTHGALSLSSNEAKKNHFRPLLPGVRHLRLNHPEDLALITTESAAVIIETIQGDAGVRVPHTSFMKALRKRCTDTGTLLILDEIQTGFGRTGKLFAFEHYGIDPDILVMAKALGAGMPIGAFMANSEVMKTLSFDPMLGHITTFGGHPVSCAAALAGIEVLENENLIEQCEEKGMMFEAQLLHPAIREVRRKGMMLAVEFDSFESVHRIYHNCLKRGVITFWFLSCNNSFRLAPPLTITHDEIEDACSRINAAIAESFD